MPAPKISALRERIAALRAKFVDAQLAAERADPLTFEPDVDALAAFRLLVHAEFEDYLEAKARDGLDAIERDFQAGKKAVRENLSILVIARALRKDIRFETQHWPTDVRDTLKTARDWITDNNGIKGTAFTMLSIFSGKMPDEIDESLSASLSTFGQARGEVAHRSVMRVTTIQAPSVETQTTEDLLKSLGEYYA